MHICDTEGCSDLLKDDAERVSLTKHDLDSVKPHPTYLFPAENSQPHGLSHLLDLEQLHISFVPGTKSLLNFAYSTYNVNCVAIDLKGNKYHSNNPF